MARRFEFTPTPAVETARRRQRYIACPVCDASPGRYLFHRGGARFVQCPVCRLVYVDPIDPDETVDFAIGELSATDKANILADFAEMIDTIGAAFSASTGRRITTAALFGQWHPEFARLADEAGFRLVVVDGTGVHRSDPDPLASADVVIVSRFLEGAPDPTEFLDALARRSRPDAMVAVMFANMAALPNRVFRRRLRAPFDQQRFLYDANNLERLMWRRGFRRVVNRRLRSHVSLGYAAARLGLPARLRNLIDRLGISSRSLTIRAGIETILFSRSESSTRTERLSIIMPVYNEERYVSDVLDALIAKDLPIEKEIIVVESNSTDRSREIVRRYEGVANVRVIYESEPRGKGHAVRGGLAAASGTIVLIQDADFEYDLDDYEALLDPILQHRTSFVLGSRSLGLDDWKVRQYADSPVKGMLMNFAQVAFARTFNVLYQQKVSDINTMFKVFRVECIDGCTFVGDGFNFDIELVCKIVRNGYEPMEVPVNYVSRGFDEGKKINFLFDAYPSYATLFTARLGVR